MVEKNVTLTRIDEVLERAKERGVSMTQWGPADFSFSRGEPGLQGLAGHLAVRTQGD